MTDTVAGTEVWSEEERRAWAPPEHLTVSQWADRHRIVMKTSEPGEWRTDRVPYLRDVMDRMGDQTTQEVVVMKTPQSGVSEGSRNVLCSWIDQDPAPCLIVFPTEPTAKENLTERVIPMLHDCPQLHQHLTGDARDLKATSLTLRTMEVYAGWSNSPSSLATRPCRYVICDETDKYPAFSGKETDPISLAEHRQTTYAHRRKTILISTPTTKHGLIYQHYEATAEEHRFAYNVPCPNCQLFQPLSWRQLRWGEGRTATAGGPLPDDEAERTSLSEKVETLQVPTWYECIGCAARLTMSDRHDMVARGEWRNKKGVPISSFPLLRRVAFHISSLFSPWVSWSRVVAKFLKSRSSHQAMMDFMNGFLGEPYEEELNRLEASVFEEKANKGAAKGLVPVWATYVLATADTGGRDAWYVVRAWGPGYRSQLLDWGHVHSLEELKAKALNVRFPVEGAARPEHGVDLLLVDTGGTYDVLDEHASRTDQVYKFCVQDPRIAAIKGTDRGDKPISPRRITYKPPNGQAPYDVILNLLNVHYFKDVLSERIHAVVGGKELWRCCQGLDDAYCQQMTSEHRILEREGTKARMAWRPISKGRPNHLFDCEVYQGAAADMVRVDLLPPMLDEPSVVETRKVAFGSHPSRPAPLPRRPLVTRRPR